MIEAGTTLQQRYQIDKQIGQGGMGAVYVATDARFGSVVAIKETLCMDDNFRKAIEREARLLNSLKHSALPRVSDHFEENNGMFLVMEYIPGADVAAMLEDPNVKFSVDQVMRWADQLLDALDYLHNQEMPVIHRDIKPQNLKVNSRGEMILLDFGLAKGNPTDAANNTAAKSIFGYSRNYASLEQIQGTGTDPRSDLYSLAATLYHMLTGIAPEDALTRAMSVLSNRPDPLAPASTVNPEVPRGVAGVLQRAMDLNANERPASASEMRQMLLDNEHYAYLADEVTYVGGPTDQRVFAQQTKLMAEGTTPIFAGSNAKTEVLGGQNLSQVTALRSTGPEARTVVAPAHTTAAPPPAARGFGFAAGALMLVLVGVVAAGGLYIMKPALFAGSREEAPRIPQPQAEVPVKAETAVTANSLPAANTAAPNLVESSAGQVPAKAVDPARPAEPTKQVETAKNTRGTAAKSTGQNDSGDVVGETIDVQLDDPEIPRGMTFTERDENGTVRTVRVNPIKPGNRTAPNVNLPMFPNIDLSKLPPAQREKLMRAFRRTQMEQKNAAPRPTPPPHQPQQSRRP